MSDASQGPGWWMAQDGKWYPPEQHPATPAPPKKKTSKAMTVAACLAIPVVVVIAIAALGSGSGKPDRYGAEYVCEEFVKDRLKSPSTAEFSNAKTRQNGKEWIVTGDVDSQNGFGAMIRSNYSCVVEPADPKGDRWTLLSIDGLDQ